MSENQEKNDIPHCKHFVVRKKRHCRMTVKSGYDYCGEHQPKIEITSTDQVISNDPRLRVTCPLDSKHTCYASKLANHLKKCNAQQSVSLPYIVRNINTGNEDNCMELNNPRLLSAVAATKIKNVISKINEIYESTIKDSISKKILTHEILTSEIANPEYGAKTKKHLLQTSSIIDHLRQAKLLTPKTCVVEFGAGKGQLSFWLSQVLGNIPESSILLVERASLRHKMDNKLDKETSNVHRVRADIADLVLSKVEIVEKSEKVVGVTKHLCGEATDLALRCLINGAKDGVNIAGLFMAFCCHHRCKWANYVGQQFFNCKNLCFDDFEIICGLVSWATCGSGLSREARKNMENRSNQEDVIETVQFKNREDELGLSREQREEIGKRAKLLLDYGRFNYLLDNKFNCNLYYYVEQDVTLENVCIVGTKI